MKENNPVVGFDFDGVIVNSLAVMEKSWAALSQKLDIDIPFSAYKKNIGLKFNAILKNIGVEEELYDEVHQQYFSGTRLFQNEVELYPEVLETLKSLKERNIQTFIVTSKPRQNTLLLLEMFGIQVDLVVCADDVTHGKPHIESGDRVVEQFGQQQVIYVGDMDSDRQFAENCNFRFVYASYGYGGLSKEVAHKIDRLSQILDNNILFS